MQKIVLLLMILPCLGMSQARLQDSLALVDLFQSCDGDNWSRKDNWLTDQPLDTWQGIKIKNDRVAEINLSNIGLKGNLPKSFYQLEGLVRLQIITGEITNSITDEVIQLSNLEQLTLNNCMLIGEVPSRLDSLTKLRLINLGRNKLTGQLPSLPSSIESIDFTSNLLEGELPNQWNGLPNLSNIKLGGNKLTGSLNILSTLNSLRSFVGNLNSWEEQPCPNWLDEMPALQSFFCTDCNLKGELDAYNWINSPSFYQLVVANNELWGNASHLPFNPLSGDRPWIDISNNSFSGMIPSELMINVSKFFARGNEFTAINSFDYESIGELKVSNNRLLVKDLLDAMPTLLADTSISKIEYESQRSPFVDTTINVIKGSKMTLYADAELSGASYQWYKNNNPLTDETDYTMHIDSASLADQGIYYCNITHPELIDRDGSLIDFDGRTYTIGVNTASSLDHDGFNIVVYPNPATDYIQVKILDSPVDFEIYTAYGILALEGKLSSEDKIDITSLLRGNYIIRLNDQEKVFISRFQKANN